MNEVHEGVKCDMCNKDNITGVRYKCMECPNYDMCENCHLSSLRSTTSLLPHSTDHKPDHMTLRVGKAFCSKKLLLLSNREQMVHKGIHCYHCNRQNICGWRYLCVQCGVNICEVCERMCEHPVIHPLLKMTPIQEPISNKPGVSFTTEQSAQSSFAFGTQPAQASFSFGTQPAQQSAQQPAQQSALSSFSFGAQQPAQPAAQPSFSFGAQQPAQPSFSFGAQQPAQPFGTQATQSSWLQPANNALQFGSSFSDANKKQNLFGGFK